MGNPESGDILLYAARFDFLVGILAVEILEVDILMSDAYNLS